ncbi:MAG: cyanophycin synthetase, partial [Thermoanaerobaculia bacterium]
DILNLVYISLSYGLEEVGHSAADVALGLVLHLLPAEREAHRPEPVDLEAEIRRLRDLADARALGPTTAALARAAEARDVPWRRLNDASLLQLGQGRHQTRIEAAVTGRTPHLALTLASDKSATNRLLRERGLPVPDQERVSGAEEAVAAAGRIGYPVVVKPLDGNQGLGVALGLASPDEVREAYQCVAERFGPAVVEAQQQGNDYRILVVDGRTVAVAERRPARVVGDGRRSVRELVDELNADPRRGRCHDRPLTRVELDEEAHRMLARSGLGPGDVPAAGRTVTLRATANLSTGGTSVDRTDEIHPDNRAMAEAAVQAVGLDVGGVDFLSPDVARSWRQTGGGIVEVNAGPGFRMHLAPSQGRARDVATPVVDMLFPPGAPARIPTAAITGTNGKTTTTRMVGHILELAGHAVGMATTDGIYVRGELAVDGDMTGPEAARTVLSDLRVDAAVLETARGGMLRAGVGFTECNVGAVLNVSADHLGLDGIDTLDELARLKRLVVELARDVCVLNADDERVAAMARHSPGEPFYVSLGPFRDGVRDRDGVPRFLAAHLARGGRAAVLEPGERGGHLVLFHGKNRIALVHADEVPVALGGRARHNLANALFAAAIARALGVRLEPIRQGLRTFQASFEQAPGRFNLYEGLPFQVLLDYAHNPAAVDALGRAVRELPVEGRRICILAGVGDRRDEDLRALGRAAAPHFDRVILREDEDLRGRSSGETAARVREGLLAAGFAADAVEPGPGHEAPGEEQALARVLALARPGDLVVILSEKPARTWRRLRDLAGDLAGADARAAEALPAGAAGNAWAATGV